MILKYEIEIDDAVIQKRISNLINQIYKLLPVKEQGGDWRKLLQTIMIELAGMHRMMNYGYSEIFFPLLNKLEGLHSLDEDFFEYRRTIFECLTLLSEVKEQICHQKN